MLGVVFSEFLEMVEERFSIDMVDAIIEESGIASGGSYTAVGNYDHQELLKLVGILSEKTGIAAGDLVAAYGRHLFGYFVDRYPSFFSKADSSIDFLETIENHIHVEVKKLYPEAELPTFQHRRNDDGTFDMIYRSRRPFSDLAQGLIEGCIDYYNDPYELKRSVLEDGAVQFRLTGR